MANKYLTVETKFKVQFYDVDSMNVVWHGNYVKFMEKGRCDLLDYIGYNYNEMKNEGYVFPITGIKVKYIKSIVYDEIATVKTMLVEWENYIKLRFEIYNEKGELCTKCESTQMAVKMPEGESQFECPALFIEKAREAMKKQGVSER